MSTDNPLGFRDVLQNYAEAQSPRRTATAAALALPLSPERATYAAQADGIVRDEYTARQWRASVEEAARDLRNLVTIHDNGGRASSPSKIKNAARELLRLLGED